MKKVCLTLVVRTAAGLIWNYIDIVQIRPVVISLRIDPDLRVSLEKEVNDLNGIQPE